MLNWLWEGWTDFWVVRSCCRVEAVRDVWLLVPEAVYEIEVTCWDKELIKFLINIMVVRCASIRSQLYVAHMDELMG